MCIFLLAPSPSHADLDGLVYYLYVKGPGRIYTPTFEFEGNNSLIVIGTSSDYGELNGVWQEVPLGPVSFFWAQVESDEPVNTTTTIPDDPSDLLPQSIQPQQTEKTKFIINLAGFAFTLPQFGTGPVFSILIGSGDYLSASGVPYIGFTSIPGPGAEPEFVSISPNTGSQESTLTNVTITGRNTTFDDDDVDDIIFSPAGNITVDRISVQSNTVVECDITIAPDASTQEYTVTVTYDGGTQSITGNNVFTVTE